MPEKSDLNRTTAFKESKALTDPESALRASRLEQNAAANLDDAIGTSTTGDLAIG
jgi:hypothetical protein